MNRVLLLGAVVIACSTGALTSDAAGIKPGVPDPTFGRHGFTSFSLAARKRGQSSNHAFDAVVDRHGRLLIAGSRSARHMDSALAAVGPDGRLDRSWGTGGRVINTFDWHGDYVDRNIYASNVAIGPRGRIFTTEVADLATKRDWKTAINENYDPVEQYDPDVSRTSYYVRAFTPSGKPVQSFGASGRTRITSDPKDHWEDGVGNTIFDLKVTRNGLIYVLFLDGIDLTVVRLRPSGSFDTRFGRRGRRILVVPPRYNLANSGRAQLYATGSKLLVTFSSSVESNDTFYDWVAMRLDARGRVDRRYGRRGRATYSWGTDFGAPFGTDGVDAILDRRGRLVFVGYGEGDGNMSRAIRLTTNGRLDHSFGVHGVVSLVDPIGRNVEVERIAETSTGRYAIAVTGSYESDFAAVQLLNDEGELVRRWRGRSLWNRPGTFDDYAAFLTKGDRIYQVPTRYTPTGKKQSRFAAFVLRR